MEKNLDVKLCIAVVALIVSLATEITGSSCNNADAEACIQAVRGNNLDTLKSYGLCQRRPYGTEFTHICSVQNYDPSVSHCCCDLDPGALCCIYQQNWNHFRCSHSVDEVVNTESGGVPLYIILPVCVAASLLLVLIIYCCVRRWCLRKHNKHDRICCGTSDKNKVDLEDEGRDQLSPLRGGGRQTSGDSVRHHSSHSSVESGVEPSAPIEEDEFGDHFVSFTTGEHCADHMRRSQSQPYPPTQPPEFFRSISASPPIGATCPSCATITPVAPPTYDESHTHQVIQ